MRIIAFLQNQWVKDPARVKAVFAKRPFERWPDLDRYLLFAGCRSGRRLKKFLGEKLCNEIIWANASAVIGGEASSYFPADMEHIKRVIVTHRPDMAIGFGKVAGEALLLGCARKLWTVQVMCAVHPACRDPERVESELRYLSKRIDGAKADFEFPRKIEPQRRRGAEAQREFATAPNQ